MPAIDLEYFAGMDGWTVMIEGYKKNEATHFIRRWCPPDDHGSVHISDAFIRSSAQWKLYDWYAYMEEFSQYNPPQGYPDGYYAHVF